MHQKVFFLDGMRQLVLKISWKLRFWEHTSRKRPVPHSTLYSLKNGTALTFEKQSAPHPILCEQGRWLCDMVGNLAFNYIDHTMLLVSRQSLEAFWDILSISKPLRKLNKQITIMFQSSKQGAEIFLFWNKIDSSICTRTVIPTCLEAAKCVFPLSLERITWGKAEEERLSL